MNFIIPNLYVGTVDDLAITDLDNTSILGACKEPLHRKHARLMGASQEGYLGKAMPKTEPEYLYAEREHALYCNLIDPPDMKYIPDEIINKCLEFIDKERTDKRNVLIVCNKGESRSPSIALMYLIAKGYYGDFPDLETLISSFKQDFYPYYNPGKGFRAYVEKFYNEYMNKLKEGQNG